ncbi:TMEM175 family protein [Nonomuraea sp. NPDC050536]|uniref:TMEM175 family protein n=1 Tax=Nonomuraea sp. NPDC050536 TaxID=3364366 RepID=UPI0037C95280
MADKETSPGAVERVAFFSDAVFAIALTLLALELPVPEGKRLGEFLASFGHHRDEYVAFLLAFVVVGGTWLAHHKLFRYMAAIDTLLLVINLVALFALILVPWASKALDTAEDGSGIALYSLVMAVIGYANLWLTLHARRAGLMRDSTPKELFDGIWVKAALPGSMFAVSVPLALVVQSTVYLLWPVVYLGIALFYSIRRVIGLRTAAPQDQPGN